jgi:hypothetical protein
LQLISSSPLGSLKEGRKREWMKERIKERRKESRLAGGRNRTKYTDYALQQIQYGFYIKDTGFCL